MFIFQNGSFCTSVPVAGLSNATWHWKWNKEKYRCTTWVIPVSPRGLNENDINVLTQSPISSSDNMTTNLGNDDQFPVKLLATKSNIDLA